MNTMEKQKSTSLSTVNMVLTALFTAILCVLSPFSIQIGPIPLSLATFVIYTSLFFLGWKKGTAACLAYLMIGLAGLPVFSGFGSGIGKMAGPTGGYLIGYIFIALIAGIIIEKYQSSVVLCVLGLVLGTAVLYAFGTAWFCLSTGSGIGAALALCVFPFIIGDCIKMAAAVLIGRNMAKRFHI